MNILKIYFVMNKITHYKDTATPYTENSYLLKIAIL